MEVKKIYIFSFACIISVFLALFILSRANNYKEKIIMIPNKPVSVSAEKNELIPAPNKNRSYKEEVKTIWILTIVNFIK